MTQPLDKSRNIAVTFEPIMHYHPPGLVSLVVAMSVRNFKCCPHCVKFILRPLFYLEGSKPV